MRSRCGRTIALVAGLLILRFAVADAAGPTEEYLGPCALVVSQDAKTLYVACADAHQVAWVDLPSGRVARRVDLPSEPTGLVLSPDGTRLIVACAAPKSTLVVLDAVSGNPIAAIPAGHTAMSPAIGPEGKRVYVANRFDNDVSVIDLEAGAEVARIAAVREPIAVALTPDGAELLVANHLPATRSDGDFDGEVVPIVTVVDTQTYDRHTMELPHGSNGLRGLCVSPDGRHALVTHLLSNFEKTPFRVDMAWINTNVLSIIDIPGRKVLSTIGLDEYDLGSGNPYDVTYTADGESVCVSLAGAHELCVIGRSELLGRFAHRTMQPMMGVWPIYVSLAESLWRRNKLPGKGPRGLAAAGSKVYVAQYFSDSVAVFDLDRDLDSKSRRLGPRPTFTSREKTESKKVGRGPSLRSYSDHESEADPSIRTIPLGPPVELTARRRGHLLFHDATICYEQWISCASCHPDGRTDGLNWDLMNDGQGNPKNTKSMLLAHRTPPAMSEGVRHSAELAVRSGIMHILFADRPEEEAVAIDEYLKSLEPVPSPHLVDGRLSASAERGRELFESERVACNRCHPSPLYTDLKPHNVGTRRWNERTDRFDTPTLVEVWRTAPYLHDGRYTTIKELLVDDRHGLRRRQTDNLSEQEIDDLVEFVLSL